MKKPNPPGDGRDPDACAILFEQYSDRLFTYFQYRCNDSNTAQDLTMQVFERLLHDWPAFDENRAPVSAWIFGIARHVVTDWQRRQYLRKFLPWDDFARQPSAEPGPEQRALDSEERRRIRQALASLSERERDILGLRFASGLTNRAIASMTELRESNVAVILFRALDKLRRSLSTPPGGEIEPVCDHPNPLVEVNHE